MATRKARGGSRKVRRTGGPSYGKGKEYKAGKPKSRAILTKEEKKDKVSERVRKKVMKKKTPSPKKKLPVKTSGTETTASQGKNTAKQSNTSPATTTKTGEYIPKKRVPKAFARKGSTIEGKATRAGGSGGGKGRLAKAGKALGKAGVVGTAAGLAVMATDVAKTLDKNLSRKTTNHGRGALKAKKKAASAAAAGPSARPNNKPKADTGGESFSSAFAKARKARLAGGSETFEYKGKKYHSYRKDEVPLKYQKGGEKKRTKEFATDPSYRPKGKNKPNK